MNIAVNTRFLLKDKLEGIGWFTYETMKRITASHPEHNFYFIFDRAYDPQFIFAPNVFPIVVPPQARHPFLFYFWFEKSIPRILKKINADIFISPDGFLSLKSKIKSIAVIHDINFMHYPEWFPFLVRKYYQYFFPRFAKKAKRIVTVSEYSKQDIVEQFGINPDTIDVVYNGSNSIYTPVSPEEILKTKNDFTNGEDFFIFVGALSPRKNVAKLISAFDLFKTKSKSKVKLLVVGEKLFKTNDIKNAYNSLQFKDDVIFAGRLQPEQLRALYGSSLALAYMPYFEGFGIPLIEAMNCGTALISSNVTSMPEVAGDAALYADPFSIESIADAMLELYNNKILRKELIQKGEIQKLKFSWDKTADKFWRSIEKLINE